ncbi:MAG: ribbon-helix-helix protein, CopG family [Bacteroidales bacterium]|nr:ribbon-helix-helix protein, CopG family [Bacteroidales bacterium]
MEEKTKRKTKTSTEVKRRYNEKVYSQISVSVPKETAAAFKAKCAAEGIPQAQVIKRAIEEFLGKQK